MDTPEEVQRETSTFEGAIDYLDSQGLVNRDRVGIIGFSRTCLFVKYALTHSKYRFAATSVTDGVDAGYFAYLAFLNVRPDLARSFEGNNGGIPFGDGLSAWIKNSPEFSIEKVKTPLRITALNPDSVLDEWGWFAGLIRLNKPVEMVALRDANHILEEPWNRVISQQGNVDWFVFWLKGEEDPGPAKVEQYARWRELQKLQQNQSNAPRN